MQKPSVVQLFRKKTANLEKTIENNALFFKDLGVEYLVYDTLDDYKILDFIKRFPDIKYIRKNNKSLKNIFLESGLIARNPKIIFLNEEDVLNYENAEKVESERPSFYKNEIKKVGELKKENFKFSEFKALLNKKPGVLSRFINWLIISN